jgi:hypothetical protein
LARYIARRRHGAEEVTMMCVMKAAVVGGLMALVGVPTAANAAVRRVPQVYPTIQGAIDASRAGDSIEVGPGHYCGATLDRTVHLIGHGQPVVVGCSDGPALSRGERIGFRLPGTGGLNPASGSSIEGFVFDGRGLSQTNLNPLALGVFAQFADGVQVKRNTFLGTIQAVTNTAGDGWTIARNEIVDLTLFDCTGALCEGGDAIVLAIAKDSLATAGGPTDPVNRPERNVVVDNRISGVIPDGFDVFSMVGIFVLAGDDTLIARNQIRLPDNPAADAAGEGILLSNSCCGEPAIVPGTRNTAVLANDGSGSQFAVVVEGSGGANTTGLVLFGNSGTIEVEGTIVANGGGHRLTRRDRGLRHLVF